MQLKQITRIGVLVLLALAGLFWIFIAASDEVDDAARPTGGMMTMPLIILGYIATFVAAGLALFYSLTSLLKNPYAKKVFINIGIFIAIFLVGLATGGSQAYFDKDGVMVASSFGSRMVSAGLFTFYVLAIAAIGLMIYTSFAKLKK